MSGTITHSWDGTVLTITSDSGTSSADLKGAKGDIGIRGPQGVPGIVDETLFYTRSNPPTAEEVGARPDDWMPTAEEVGARPDDWMPTAAEVGAAPSGYGLGTTGSTVADANQVFDTFRNGWYRTISTTANTAVTHGAGIALVYDANRAFHLLAKTTAGTMRTRYTPNSDGVFVEDLINPPMTLGVEYRTTERWQGKVVYTKLVSVGALPNASSKTVDTGVSGATVFRTHLVSFGADGAVRESPYITSAGVCKIRHNVDGYGNLTISTSSNEYADATNYCQIWYTKD